MYDLVIISLLSFSLIINIVLLIKQLRNNTNEHIISELKINLRDNNLDLIDSVNRKIAESEQKQQRELLTNKLETVERIDRNSNKLTESFTKFSADTSKTLNENFISLNERVSQNLDRINLRVEERLNEGFE